ncbi:hypothetical protein [Dellaglioa algida]|uniref:hypothetical protein n=1 Tax=Dellaglioa algida TaxID=105612 RepID=UPI0012ED3A9F|nr:hypothetical protein [Dellaglioa algida]MDK1718155.1 hypothetical protein [Dellaglioa algida]MDK1729076.1 hypothetical protein [Dellaglioa algida]MDK1733481.1 hypothetical protein [Dellaglioa algida]MDK1735002.1 hypothetical protein [Dellaglioa algida]MDK1741510.1 hypothetical protein [Dellaglioa algida]
MKKIKVTIPMYIPRMMLNWILEKKYGYIRCNECHHMCAKDSIYCEKCATKLRS